MGIKEVIHGGIQGMGEHQESRQLQGNLLVGHDVAGCVENLFSTY